MIINFVITIVLALFLVRGLFQTNYPGGTCQPLSARQILELRCLRSEINHEKYLIILKDIRNPKPSKQKGQSKKGLPFKNIVEKFVSH